MTLPEQGGFNEKLGEILAAVYLAGTENGLGRRIADPEEIVHRREAFIKVNPVNNEAKAAIRTLILEEIINEPSDTVKKGDTAFTALEKFRAEQRAKLKEVMGGE